MTDAVRIASWNIRKGLGTDRKRSPARILSVLDDLKADIMVLQEADFRIGDRKPALPHHLIDAAGFTTVSTHHATPSIGWHGNAILLRDGMTCGDVDMIELPGLEPRGALCAEIKGHHGALRIVGLHLGLLRRSRQQQLTRITEVLEGRANMPTVLIGDFNERSQTLGFEPLKGAFEVGSPGPTYHARFPRASLDRMAYNAQVSLIRLETINTAQTRLASDHLPILGHFRVQNDRH